MKYAAAYVVMPGGFGTLDELSEALTLMQTGKGKPMPIMLVGTRFWSGLLDWMRSTLLAEGMIGAADLDMMRIVDDSDSGRERDLRLLRGARVRAERDGPREAAVPVVAARGDRPRRQRRSGRLAPHDEPHFENVVPGSMSLSVAG